MFADPAEGGLASYHLAAGQLISLFEPLGTESSLKSMRSTAQAVSFNSNVARLLATSLGVLLLRYSLKLFSETAACAAVGCQSVGRQ